MIPYYYLFIKLGIDIVALVWLLCRAYKMIFKQEKATGVDVLNYVFIVLYVLILRRKL